MLRPKNLLVCAIALFSFFARSVYGACPVGDVHQDSDCQVNWLDLRDFADQWLNGGCSAPWCRADLDGVPGVTIKDYALLADNWMAQGSYTLVINEFMADNAGTIEDPDESGEYADWFEIYNYGKKDIDIGGMYVKDDTTWWRIPTGYPLQTTVKARTYLLLWADNDPEQGPLHVDFALGRSRDQIGIYDAFRHPIDVVSFTSQIQDRSRGRLPDGSSNWITFEIGSATPGATNRGKPVKVVINEIMYHPGHAINTPENIGEEYIELYNNGEEPIGLLGWRFTNGVNYTVTDDVIIGVGGYYVIASDVNVFKAKYPEVTNVVGGWDGHLSNSGETVELVDQAGVLVDKLEYADQGDWAVRYLGPVDRAHRGWEWSDDHDGGGKSLELINPAVANEYGQNWAASQTDGGTPGSSNTISDSDIAPLILDVEHLPIIPGPNHAVTVTAQILDELTNGVSTRLHYRVDRSVYTGDESIYPHYSPSDYNDVPMFDDGAHADGAAGDGLYGVQIPACTHGAIVEFFVEARDAAANTRTWPAPSSIDGTPEQVTNLLYQVDSSFDPEAWVAGDQPIYYIIMTNMERARLEDIVRNHSDLEGPNSQMNATFISVDGVDIKARYIVGVRNRGHGTRNDWPNNYHLNFVHDRPWKDVTAINLNTAYTYLQAAGNAVFRLSGLAQAEAGAVQVRTNGQNLAESGQRMYGSYVHVESVNSDFAANHFPDDDEGNAYKAMRVTHQADLRYEGALPGPYRQNYFKETNASADDWSDLIELCNVLSNTPDSSYVEEVNRVLDAEQWLRLIAVNVLLSNCETTLANGNGDDYYLYRGFNDTRFVLVQHDLDSIFGMGQSVPTNPPPLTRDIFLAANIPTINRLMKHPQFVPRYYYHLKDLIETTFSPEQMNAFLDEHLGDFVAPGTIQQMKDFVVQRNAYVLSRIPSDLTIVSDLPQVSGYYSTDADVAILYGEADAVRTRSVRVNGRPAVWYPVDGEWNVAEPQQPDYDSLVDRGARWRYFDEYTDLGSVWYVDVNDSGWAEGDAELGYGDGTETTPIGYIVTNPGTPEQGKNITTYFTRRFNVADVSKYSALSLRIRRDDGAVIYLNGQEIARSNMLEGTVGYNTLAGSNVYGTDVDGRDVETLYYGGGIYANDDDFTSIDIGFLQNGENILAVEIHQFQTNGADISFDLELMGLLKDSGPAIGVPLNPGINRIIVQAFDGPDGTGNEVDSGYIDVWYNDGDESTIAGTLAIDRTLDAASGPWHVTGDIVVPSGRTLTIEPGATLFFDAGTRITVTSGGRLAAEGTDFGRIRFTKTPGGGSWAGFEFLNTGEDNRIAYADMEYCDSGSRAIRANLAQVYMDHVIWGNHTKQYLTFDDSSIILTNSVLPSVTNAELVHYWGFPADGYALFEGNWFGSTTGYNDIIDFTGGQRPGPIAQFLNNIFTGASDDCIDMDAADAHVEGNVFMHIHMDSPRESKSHAVTTGTEYGQVSELTVVRNLFYDVDHALLSKDGGFITAVNNTIVHATVAAVNMYEPRSGQWQGLGFYGDGNIFYDVAHMFENPDWAGHPTSITMNNSIFPIISGDPIVWIGSGNIYDTDPQLYNTTDVTDPRIDFGFRPDSPGSGTGPNGRDMGGLVPAGASISGEPAAVTGETTATLTVGGPDIYGYKYRVNSGSWSGEILRPDPVLPGTPVQPFAPIHLTGLADGTYTVYVIIKNSASMWQAESEAVASRTWTVDSSYYPPLGLVINEVLAHTHGNDPDIIELYYDGPQSIDLTGMGLTDNPVEPNKFEFSPVTCSQTIMNPGDYIILYGDLTTLQNHLGFALSADGEALYLYDKPNPDGSRDLLDSVEFGPQINDYSIGRVGWDRQWKLNQMTFGSANIAHPLGNPYTLKINEWLANGQVLFDDDFVELYNPHPQPVSLGGLYLTDDPVAQPNKRQIVPLSFIPPEGYAVFWPNDGNDPSELNFKLSADGEMIGLFDADLNMIDQVLYGPQTTDVSQGRSPDGSSNYDFFDLPTPGVANTSAPIITTVTTVLAAESATKRAIVPTLPNDVDETWKSDPAFNDSSWLLGVGSPGGVGFETNPGDAINYVSLITLDVEAQMDNINETCYIRIPFTVDGDDLADFTDMTLKIRYDDGFVAYINGTELVTARRNFAGTPEWNSGADGQHSDSAAILFEYIDVFDYLGALRAGDNVLAIHGLNYLVSSSDFLISAELEGAITTIDYGEFPYPDAPNQLAGLRITELMYHDPSGSNFDYIELKNISDAAIKLDGLRFVDGIEFEFPAGQLNPNECIVVVGNLTSFRARYGYSARVAGQYTGALSGGGEKIVLSLAWPLEAAIMRFEYNDTWYPTTDGGGQSLHINDATIHPYLWNEAESWHAAAPSPGLP